MAEAFCLTGSSMLPVFKPGGLVLVRPLDPAAPASGLSPGDCAVYAYKGRTLLHRVLKTGPGGAWFADDAGRIAPHLAAWPLVRGKVLSGNPLAGGCCGLLYSRLRRALYKAWSAWGARS